MLVATKCYEDQSSTKKDGKSCFSIIIADQKRLDWSEFCVSIVYASHASTIDQNVDAYAAKLGKGLKRKIQDAKKLTKGEVCSVPILRGKEGNIAEGFLITFCKKNSLIITISISIF